MYQHNLIKNLVLINKLKGLFTQTLYLIFSYLVIGYSIKYIFFGGIILENRILENRELYNNIVLFFITLFALTTLLGIDTGILSQLSRGKRFNFKVIRGLKHYFDLKRISHNFLYFLERISKTIISKCYITFLSGWLIGILLNYLRMWRLSG